MRRPAPFRFARSLMLLACLFAGGAGQAELPFEAPATLLSPAVVPADGLQETPAIGYNALPPAPVPMLCQQCHSHVRHPNDLFTSTSLRSGSAPDERLMARGCITCHAQVHGSNHPSGPRLHK